MWLCWGLHGQGGLSGSVVACMVLLGGSDVAYLGPARFCWVALMWPTWDLQGSVGWL